MDSPSPDELLEAFGVAARDALALRETVPVPSLGVLRVLHEPSRSRPREDGRRELLPPRDRIVLETEPATT